MKEKRTDKFLVLARAYIALAWAFLILLLMTWPTPEYFGQVVTLQDKLAHALMFGVLAWLLARVLSAAWHRGGKPAFLGAAALAAADSFLMELLQEMVPGRTASIYDFLAGLAGIAAALYIYYAFKKRKK